MIKSKLIHSGQYHRYGDHVSIWEIETDESRESVLEYCFTQLHNGKLPTYAEWTDAIRYPNGEHCKDMAYYFAGNYTLLNTDTGYRFTVCFPYAD